MIFLYLMYVIVSAVLLALLFPKDKGWLLKLVLVAFLPIIGWLLPILWPQKFIKNNGNAFETYVHKQNEDVPVELLAVKIKVKKEKELNIIPIEDALVTSDYVTRRKVMIDVLKEDTLQYMEVIKIAVLNEDTETSHYAVSAIMEVKRKLSIAMQGLSVKFEQNPFDLHIANSYAQVLKEYMTSGFLDAQTLKKYKYTYIQVLNQLLQNGMCRHELFEEKIATEIEVNEYAKAEQTCLHYLREYPDTEQPYLALMELYYKINARNKMSYVLEDLKRSNIKLSNRALTIVRYWSGGMLYENQLEVF